MEDFKPTNKTDKDFLDHLRWASKLLTDKVFNLDIQDQFLDIKKIDEYKKNGFWTIVYTVKIAEEDYLSSKSLFIVQIFYHSNIIPVEWQPFLNTKTLFSPGLEWRTLFYFEIMYGPLYIKKKIRSHEGKPLIEIFDERYSTRAYKKAVAQLGWRKREWDGIPKLLVNKDKLYKPIDFLIQMAIFAIQKGAFLGIGAILNLFNEYIERFNEPRFDGRRNYSPLKNFHYIDEDMRIEVLQKIIKNYFLPRTPASFESYVCQTLKERIWATIKFPGRDSRKRQKEFRERFIKDREKEGKSFEAARRDWYRKLQKSLLLRKTIHKNKDAQDFCSECLSQSICFTPCPEKLLSEKD